MKRERSRKRDNKRKKKCSKEKSRKNRKINNNNETSSSVSDDDSDEPNVRRSAISGGKIKMHIKKTDDDIVRERVRKEILKFMNSVL